MTKELLLLELCKEVLDDGINTERFNRLWLETGVCLEGAELEIAGKLKQRWDETAEFQFLSSHRTVH